MSGARLAITFDTQGEHMGWTVNVDVLVGKCRTLNGVDQRRKWKRRWKNKRGERRGGRKEAESFPRPFSMASTR